ncbi:MAG TPA: 4-hydroxy-tetrahydrodipicolinate synthase [Candidatus Tumulicola sp.]|nr:4-hydroxy-tetrahydrodipicolinate synthase [Candidatus Tumulicola sp.]
MSRFGPVVTAMITPMRDTGAVDYDEAGRLAAWLCERGTTGLVIAGTTGESPTLSDEEKLRLFVAVAQAVRGKAKVIANTGGNDTHHSVELSKKAEQCGVDALLLVGPYYNKPPQAGLIEHFTAIADAVKTPIAIYNIPGRTAVNILPDTIVSLSKHPLIVAVKESSGDLMQIAEIIARVAPDFDVYSGDDHLTLPIAAIGGRGIVSVISHVAGEDVRAMLDAFQAGDSGRAAALHAKLLPLCKALFAVTSPIPVKAAMRRFGFATGRCRPPLCPLNAEQERALDAAIAPWLRTLAAAPAR